MDARMFCRSIALVAFILVITFGLAQAVRNVPSDETPQAKDIPLSSVYSTNGQEGLVRIGYDTGSSKEIEQIRRRMEETGASNVFMVRSKDFKGAVLAARKVFVGVYPADQPVSVDANSKDNQYWAVVFLGVYGSGSAWSVNSCKVDGRNVRVNFAKGISEAGDVCAYLYWIPLGSLAEGTYRLELFDEGDKQVALMRSVKVSKD